MNELVCIVCPKGCTMHIEQENGTYKVSGNTCKRGAQFAVSEMTEPKGYNNIGQRKSHTVRRKSPAMWLFLYPI